MRQLICGIATAGYLFVAACTTWGPRSGTGAVPDAGKRAAAPNGMMSTAHPLASDAGVEMLVAGGNAVDAAVAAAFTIGVVEPQMSGVGGSGSMLIWLQNERRAEYLNFYAAQPVDRFRALDNPQVDSTVPLRIVGVPGAVAGLLEAHARFGRLSRQQVLAPAIRIAERGFPVNQVLAQLIARDSLKLRNNPGAQRLVWPDEGPLPAGALLVNPALATTLRRIAAHGRTGFYEGETAHALVNTLKSGGHPLELEDLRDYQPEWKRPLCGTYRGRVILSAPPPQTGMQVIHTLKLLEPYDLPDLGYPTQSARAFDVFTSAIRVGLTVTRNNDDPNWALVPARGVASAEFAKARRTRVGTGEAADTIYPDDAARFDGASIDHVCTVYDPYGPAATPATSSQSRDRTTDDAETTHLSVVDAEGNAVALTQTNSSVFGTGVVVSGFFLNNSGVRFATEDLAATSTTRWRVRQSTISPTIILENGQVRMVVGAPGGGRIPTAIVQAITYVLDYGLDPLDALRMPRLFASPVNRRVQLEHGFSASTLQAARTIGYEPDALSFGYARLYVVVRDGNQWIGAADPRHDGEVRGY